MFDTQRLQRFTPELSIVKKENNQYQLQNIIHPRVAEVVMVLDIYMIRPVHSANSVSSFRKIYYQNFGKCDII